MKIFKTTNWTVIAAVLLLSSPLGGCWRKSVQETSPHVVASLSDHQYIWFLYRSDPPELKIWRVGADSASFERYTAPAPQEEFFKAWQADGSWIWFLTSESIYRVGRFPPDAGDVEKFQPDVLKPEILGAMNAFLVQNSRMMIASTAGLFLFDRQTQQLTQISPQKVSKLRMTPYGMLAVVGHDFYMLDTHAAEPTLKKIELSVGKNWGEIPQDAYVTMDPERAALVALTGRYNGIYCPLENLPVRLEAREVVKEAYYFSENLWLLTSQPRLLVVNPHNGSFREYCLYYIQGITPEFSVQDGRLRCGPIIAETVGSELQVKAVRFYPGDIKPLPMVNQSVPVPIRQPEKQSSKDENVIQDDDQAPSDQWPDTPMYKKEPNQ